MMVGSQYIRNKVSTNVIMADRLQSHP
jgi:hypothetical protein